jgi:hypothetical protein
MAGGQEREISRDITSARAAPSEPKQLPDQHGEITPRASLPQEEERSNEPSHEDMVAAIRRTIAQKRAEKERNGYKFDPVEYVGDQLISLNIKKGGLEYSEAGPSILRRINLTTRNY